MHSKQRAIPLILAGLLAIFLSLPVFAVADSELTAEEVLAIAWEDIRLHSGLTDEEIATFRCEIQVLDPEYNGARYWRIVLVSDIANSEYSLQVEHRNGHVYNTDHPGYAEAYRESLAYWTLFREAKAAQAEWETTRGPYPFWSYQDKAAFHEAYEGADRRHLPEPGHLSEAEAIGIFKDELARVLLADEAYMDAYRLDTGYMVNFLWNLIPTPTWLIAYRAKAATPDGEYPVRHHCIINAETGEIILNVYDNGQSVLVGGEYYQDTMYYNPDGGEYFHYDTECHWVSEAYRPLKPYARGDVIHNDVLLSLMPCPSCVYHFDEYEGWGIDMPLG